MVSRRRVLPVRGAGEVALLAPAAFAVHQLRYLLAYGSSAGIELQRTGHSYLHSLAPWLVLLIALSAGAFLRALGQAFAGQTSAARFSASFAVLWAACTAVLVAVFAGQELLEGLFATGHPAGLVGIFGYGGWWAIPVAGCIGLVLAAVFHGARWVVERVAARSARRPVARRARLALPRLPEAWLPAPAPLADGWSGRGPPRA
jgi:hypothetical protein